MTTPNTTSALVSRRADPCHKETRRLSEDNRGGARLVALTVLASTLTSVTLIVAAVSWVLG